MDVIMTRCCSLYLAFLISPCVAFCAPAHAVTNDGLALELTDDGELTGLSYCGSGDEFARILELRVPASKFEAVQSVTLTQHHIVASEIEAIGRMKLVALLHLGYFPDPVTISDDAVRRLPLLSSLEEFSGDFKTSTNTPWEELGKLQKLQILSLTGDVTLRQKALDAIGTLPELIHLRIDGCIECDDFRWLASLKNLNSVDLESNHINPGLVDAIRDLPDLERVELRGFVFKTEHLRALPDRFANQLKRLQLEVAADVTTDTLARFSNLQTLAIHVPDETQFDLSLVRKLPRLEILTVRGSALSGVSQEGICDHPTLRQVQLTDSTGVRVFVSVDCRGK